MNCNISFGSKINFVDAYRFKNLKHGEYIDWRKNFLNCTDSPAFYTDYIADCTAGGIINPHKQCLGFHIRGDYSIKQLPFTILGTPERALIIGSKNDKFSVNSMGNFESIKNSLGKKVKHLTYFQEHKPKYSSSDIFYSLPHDTWIINTIYGHFFLKEVDNIRRLLKVFRKIKIADGDRLFINEKEILPKECPEIF